MTQTIVVIDDSEIILDFVREALEQAGYRVVTSSNPLLAAVHLRREQPDLVLLDVEMPGLPGPEVVRALRRSDCLEHAKVVLYSSRDADSLAQLALDCGAIGSIPKTVDSTRLASRVGRYLERTATLTRGLLLKKVIVIVQDGAVERKLVNFMEAAGLSVETRGAIGIDRVLREGSPDLLVLDPDAFAGTLENVLERLSRRGLLNDVGVLAIGEASLADTNLRLEQLDEKQVRKAVKAALSARDARRSAAGA